MVLPLDVELVNPGVAVLAAAALLVLASFFGLAASQTAAVMRVLDPDRHIPPPPPKPVRRARRMLLGPLAEELADLEELAAQPPSMALPTAQELPPGTRVRCTVLIPAHNEEAVLGRTLESLAAQTRPPDRITVVADNCTDAHRRDRASGPGRGRRDGRQLREEGRRAQPGALASAARRRPPRRGAGHGRRLDHRPRCSSTPPGDGSRRIPPWWRWADSSTATTAPDSSGQCQRNEYGRYQRMVARQPGPGVRADRHRSVIRAYALTAVAERGAPLIPGRPGEVYDTLALTEDNELTLSLKTLGARMTSPPRSAGSPPRS